MKSNNRQYELMQDAARQKIQSADPNRIASMTGLHWNGSEFETKTLGIPIRISWPECRMVPSLNMWHDLTILQYLANTTGTELTGEFIALSAFSSGGLARGSSFDRENDRTISRLGKYPEQAIRDAAAKLGGRELNGNSDLTFVFSFLPHVPVKLNLWLEDEDFPASGKVLFDASAQQELQMEAAGTAAAACLSLLERILKNQS